MRVIHVRTAGLAVAAAAVTVALTAAPAFATPSSYAYGASGNASSQGTATALPPVGYVKGSGKYDKRALVPYASESLGLVSAGNLIGAVSVTAAAVSSHVSGTGGAVPKVVAEADGSVGSVQMAVELIPPPGSTQPAAAPLLTLSMSNLASSLSASQMLPSVAVLSGTASFGSLTIGGSLLPSTLTFSGAAPANTVLYDAPHITVTLNEQIVTGAIQCVPKCAFVPQSMTADALAIHINGALVLGKVFNTNFKFGETHAQVP
jgi:hypothetical protein